MRFPAFDTYCLLASAVIRQINYFGFLDLVFRHSIDYSNVHKRFTCKISIYLLSEDVEHCVAGGWVVTPE